MERAVRRRKCGKKLVPSFALRDDHRQPDSFIARVIVSYQSSPSQTEQNVVITTNRGDRFSRRSKSDVVWSKLRFALPVRFEEASLDGRRFGHRRKSGAAAPHHDDFLRG